MKIKEIKELETKDLAERIESEVAKYNQMKLNHAITPLENPSQIKLARRDIARMKTVLLSSRRCTRYMVSLSRRQRNTMPMMRRMRQM